MSTQAFKDGFLDTLAVAGYDKRDIPGLLMEKKAGSWWDVAGKGLGILAGMPLWALAGGTGLGAGLGLGGAWIKSDAEARDIMRREQEKPFEDMLKNQLEVQKYFTDLEKQKQLEEKTRGRTY